MISPSPIQNHRSGPRLFDHSASFCRRKYDNVEAAAANGIAVPFRQDQIDFIGVHDSGKGVPVSVRLADKAVGLSIESLANL